ncbi:MAG: hypothetical protein P8O07_11640 [Crocinitomicaceae bacterium]|nr:hypothetical protein [Crocinitomicaceae bacterium]
MRLEYIRNFIISSVSLETYTANSLPSEWISTLQQERAFHLFVPKEFGGLQLSLSQGILALMHISKLHGSLGWVLNLGAGANYFSGCFAPDIACSLFQNPSTILAGSGDTSGTVREINKKYIINGAWNKCTGAAHASHFTFNAKHKDGRISSFLISRELVEMQDNWPIMGLKATSSHGITINNQIIREEHRFIVGEIKNNHAYSVFQLEFETFARLCLSASFVGIVDCFVSHAEIALKHSKSPIEALQRLKIKLSTSTSILLECAHLHDEFQELSIAEKTLAKNHLIHELPSQHEALFHGVQQLFLTLGMSVMLENNLLHWAYKDVLTAVQHYYLKIPRD